MDIDSNLRWVPPHIRPHNQTWSNNAITLRISDWSMIEHITHYWNSTHQALRCLEITKTITCQLNTGSSTVEKYFLFGEMVATPSMSSFCLFLLVRRPVDTWVITQWTSATAERKSSWEQSVWTARAHQNSVRTTRNNPLGPPHKKLDQSAASGASRRRGQSWSVRCHSGCIAIHHFCHCIANSVALMVGTFSMRRLCFIHHDTSSGLYFTGSFYIQH